MVKKPQGYFFAALNYNIIAVYISAFSVVFVVSCISVYYVDILLNIKVEQFSCCEHILVRALLNAWIA